MDYFHIFYFASLPKYYFHKYITIQKLVSPPFRIFYLTNRPSNRPSNSPSNRPQRLESTKEQCTLHTDQQHLNLSILNDLMMYYISLYDSGMSVKIIFREFKTVDFQQKIHLKTNTNRIYFRVL